MGIVFVFFLEGSFRMSCFRQIAVAAVAGALVFAQAAVTPAATYVLDNSHTSIIFGINHFGYSVTYGRFNEAMGQFVWDDANPSANNFQVAIKTASVDTNDEKRDGHLRGPDFFNANQYPQITFVTTKAIDFHQKPRPDGASHTLTGNLTMHGVTKEITLPVKKLGEGPGPYGKYRMGFYCETTLKRSDYGMANMIPAEGSQKGIGDEIAVTISFEGIRQGDSASAGGDAATRETPGADVTGSPAPVPNPSVPQ